LFGGCCHSGDDSCPIGIRTSCFRDLTEHYLWATIVLNATGTSFWMPAVKSYTGAQWTFLSPVLQLLSYLGKGLWSRQAILIMVVMLLRQRIGDIGKNQTHFERAERLLQLDPDISLNAVKEGRVELTSRITTALTQHGSISWQPKSEPLVRNRRRLPSSKCECALPIIICWSGLYQSKRDNVSILAIFNLPTIRNESPLPLDINSNRKISMTDLY
jgi:hypothetical protein